ncbi:MAG: formate dehydrogenase accessory sulfurtransferase FdhD, partial [Acidimicrobiia bacterium]|nr:formate dehydrogenase accessory sulfurtransferase FdhD [Acidimicrobiia bacterium]
KASIDAVLIASRPLPEGPVLDPADVAQAVGALRSVQPAFDLTGGLHGAAVQLSDGTMLGVAEDIGRHNAVDKTIGAAVAGRSWPLDGTILLVSGRVSFEIVQKAAVAGIPIVAGISAASSLAVDLASELGMTLVAFLRAGAANVYSGAGRLA